MWCLCKIFKADISWNAMSIISSLLINLLVSSLSNEVPQNWATTIVRSKQINLILVWFHAIFYTIKIYYKPCFPLMISKYWQRFWWTIVFNFCERPYIVIELGVRGNPLLPHVSPLCGWAKKVMAPSCICSFSKISSCIMPVTTGLNDTTHNLLL